MNPARALVGLKGPELGDAQVYAWIESSLG